MKKLTLRALAIVMALCLLTGCASAETIDYVQRALDEENRLTRTNCFIAGDGSLLTLICGESARYGTFAVIADPIDEHSYASVQVNLLQQYATLGKLKKLSASDFANDDLYAVTESGELHYGIWKLKDNVADFILPPGGADFDEGVILTKDHAFTDYLYDKELVDMALADEGAEPFITVPIVSADSAAELYYTAIDADGRPYAFLEDSSYFVTLETDAACDISQWTDLAVFKAAVKGSHRGYESLTFIGIRKDGAVLACGDSAEEVLSWGPLAYVDTYECNIIGITPDGKVRITGPDTANIAETVESWTDIAAVRFIGLADGSTRDIALTAMTADETFYYLDSKSWSDGSFANNFAAVNPATGFAAGDRGSSYKFMTDGSCWECNFSETGWTAFTPEP